MTLSAQQKGKGRLLPQESAKRAGFSSSLSPSSTSSSPSSSHSSSESESDEDSSEDEEDDVSQEYLDSLLERARRSISSKAIGKTVADEGDVLEEDIIGLDDPESELKCVFFPLSLSFPFGLFLSYSRSLPPLDPGTLPNSYITLGKTLNDAPLAVRDLGAERVMESSSSLSAPAPPAPPPELTKSGKPLTKKEKKAVGRSQVIQSMHCRANALIS
jgi:hypothetical protein